MRELTKGSPAKVIMTFALPIIFGNLLQQLYNLADGKIVSTYVGTQAFAAVGATAVIANLIIGFVNGVTQGFGIPISRCFGAGDYKNMRHYDSCNDADSYSRCASWDRRAFAYIGHAGRYYGRGTSIYPHYYYGDSIHFSLQLQCQYIESGRRKPDSAFMPCSCSHFEHFSGYSFCAYIFHGTSRCSACDQYCPVYCRSSVYGILAF